MNWIDDEIESIIKDHSGEEIVVNNKVKLVDQLMDDSPYSKPYTLDDRLSWSLASFNRVKNGKLLNASVLYLILVIYFESQEIIKEHCK